VPYGTRAPKELLHHQPALIGYAGSVFPHTCREEARGLRGSRLLDRGPPHYRCPAVPGHMSFARAILMALNSSVLSLCTNYFLTAGGLSQRHFRQPAPSPVLHLLRLRTPLPNLPVRAPQSDAIHRGTAGTATAPTCYGTADGSP